MKEEKMNLKRKKIILGISTMSLVALPLSTAIACGHKSHTTTVGNGNKLNENRYPNTIGEKGWIKYLNDEKK